MSETKDIRNDVEAESKEAATPAETREYFTKLSGRGYMQLRHVLVQLPDHAHAKERGSTVGRLASERRQRALLLYLLILTTWPWMKDRKIPVAADVWLRALEADKALTWSHSTLSRALKDLEIRGLVTRERVGKAVKIIPRREDGLADYTAPEGRKDRDNTYFTLPDSFWTDELFAKLNLPGLAMLLVIAEATSKNPEMYIPHDQGQPWYGLKPGMVKDGITKLRELELIEERDEWTKAPLSPIGKTRRIYYSLKGEYSQESRQLAQKRAQNERSARLKKQPKNSA